MLACDETESRANACTDLAQALRAHCFPSVIRADNTELYQRMAHNTIVSNDGAICEMKLS